MWDFSHVEAGSLVSPLLKERDFALRIGCFVPGMWLLRSILFMFLLGHSILSDPNWEYDKQSIIYWERWAGVDVGLSALGFGWGKKRQWSH